MEAMQLHFRGERPAYRVEYRIRHKDGAYKWFQDTGQIVATSEEGDPLTVAGVVIDITDWKQAQDTINQHRETEAGLIRSQSMLSQSRRMTEIGSWELKFETKQLTWSDEVFSIFEILPDEFSGTYEDFLSLVHPDDREKVDQTYQDSVKDKTIYHIVHRILLKDGRIKRVREWGETFFDDDEQPTHSVGLIQEISDKDETVLLGQFQAAVAVSEDSFVMTNPGLPDNPIVYVNPAFEKITGYSAAEVIGKNPRLLQNDDRNQPASEKLRQAIATNSPGQTVIRNYDKNGRMFYNKVTIYPLKDAEGKTVRWLGIQRQVSEPDTD
jgi:PAS domain S-box-containing protein